MAAAAGSGPQFEGTAEAFLLSRKSQLPSGQVAVYGRVLQVDLIDRKIDLIATAAIQESGKIVRFPTPYPVRLLLDTRPAKSAKAPVNPRIGFSYGFVVPNSTFVDLIDRSSARASQIWEPTEAAAPTPYFYPNTVLNDAITLPMVFPVLGGANWSDTFLVDRDGGKRKHLGQDLMSPKLTPLVAAIDGVVQFKKGKDAEDGNSITITREDGWRVVYLHVNCDTPGTADGKGSDDYAFAPGLKSGDAVRTGQFVGWVGDSGNARQTAPHCHFEIRRNGVINAGPSLASARKISAPISVIAQTDLPDKGEIRYDAVVLSAGGNKGIFDCMLVAEIHPDGEIKMLSAPTTMSFKLLGAKVRHRALSDQRINLPEIGRGSKLTVIGSVNDAQEFLIRTALVVPDQDLESGSSPLIPFTKPSPVPPKPENVKPPVLVTPTPLTPAPVTPKPERPAADKPTVEKPSVDKPPVRPAGGRSAIWDAELERAREREGVATLTRSRALDEAATEFISKYDVADVLVVNVLKPCQDRGLVVQEAYFVSAPFGTDPSEGTRLALTSFRSRPVVLDGKWNEIGLARVGNRVGWLLVRK